MRRLLIAAGLLAACKKDPPPDVKLPNVPEAGAPATSGSVPSDPPNNVKLITPAFMPSAPIPKLHTCDGDDKSPEVKWQGVPLVAKTFALIVEDPDAPIGTFVHWLIWDIPEPSNTIPEGVSGMGTLGKNDFGKLGWGGPCPPKGKPHRYFFRFYALDVESLKLKDGATRAELEAAMKGHVLARGETMGTYARE